MTSLPESITVFTHPECLNHDTGPGHPESAARLQRILNELSNSYLASQLHFTKAPKGTIEQILLAHGPDLVQLLQNAAPSTGRVAVDADTVMSPGSWQAALRGTGAICKAIDDLANGRISTAFCATRPPGHHATADQAMGFCLINHIAIGALYARKKHGIARVAVVDFDVHHGNGSQDILGNQDGILYISTHQSPLYPGTGSVTENRPGHILNVPLPSTTNGESFRELFTQQVLPALDAFQPGLILVSAGFDAHRNDPLAGLSLTEEDYQWLGEKLKCTARAHSGGKLAAVLEGGYDLDALASSVTAFLDGILQAG